MSRPTLAARPRQTTGKAVSRLRRDGLLPGVVYGGGMDTQLIELDAHEFELLHRQTGRHAVLDLKVEGDGRPRPVLLHQIQEHPVTRKPLHIDLLAVNLEEERTVDVPVAIVGESAAIDRMGGVLLHLRDAVMVRAKPDDLPSSLELDITPLDSFEAVLHASDLQVPAGVTLVTDPGEALVRVQPPRVEEPVAGQAPAGEDEAAPSEDAAGETADEASATDTQQE